MNLVTIIPTGSNDILVHMSAADQAIAARQSRDEVNDYLDAGDMRAYLKFVDDQRARLSAADYDLWCAWLAA